MNTFLVLFALSSISAPQDRQITQQRQDTALAQGGRGGGGGFQAGVNSGRVQAKRPYEDVVTEDLTTKPGVFTVHTKGERLLFEIPNEMLDRDFLWVTEVQKSPAGGYNGTAAGDRVVRWERRGDRVLLRTVNYGIRATDGDAIKSGVQASNVMPIVMAFDVMADNKDGAPVIDVARLYTSDPAEFSVKGTLGVGNVDSARSFFDSVSAFPNNINCTSTLTFTQGAAPAAGGFGGFGRNRQGGGPSNTAVVHYSMTLLPADPMMGRFFDSRVGFFSEGFQDYGTNENRVAERQFITRYRLEKKDPGAAMSEPVQPIVYYLGREVPEKWRSYIKQGIEDWQSAFEKAGFKNAIIAKDAPSAKEDSSWSEEDARYSVIRWAPTPTENAQGPNVHDPRSGEIISAHIIIWHNVVKLAQDWYFVQASPNNSAAQKLPLPEPLMGRLIRYVVSHEVGHTLGLQHNFKASSAYTVAQLRNPSFTSKFGTEASIMDYGRFNYVAQPKDGASLIPVIGPYDKFAIQWGYTPLPNAKTPDSEKPTLDKMAAVQMKDARLLFGSNRSGGDPTQQSEDLGSDSVEATRLGLLNLKRVAGYLEKACTKPGEDYADLEGTYGQLWSQFNLETGHVLTVVGGVTMRDYHAGRGGEVYTPVSRERQKAAVALLAENVLCPPVWMTPKSMLAKFQGTGAASRLNGASSRVITSLLSDARLMKMFELQARDGKRAYGPKEMIGDIRSAIFPSTKMPPDYFCRETQRTYINTLSDKITSDASDVRALASNELRSLAVMLKKTASNTRDQDLKAHFLDLNRSIQEALMLKNVVTIPAAAPAAGGGGGGRGGPRNPAPDPAPAERFGTCSWGG